MPSSSSSSPCLYVERLHSQCTCHSSGWGHVVSVFCSFSYPEIGYRINLLHSLHLSLIWISPVGWLQLSRTSNSHLNTLVPSKLVRFVMLPWTRTNNHHHLHPFQLRFTPILSSCLKMSEDRRFPQTVADWNMKKKMPKYWLMMSEPRLPSAAA